MHITSKLPNTGTTIFSVMSALANEHEAINLSQGFPDYPCDPRLINLVTEAMNSGYNQYAPMMGLPLLRQQIALKINALYGLNINADKDVTITSGATQGLFTAIAAFVHSGDEVIIIEPAYDSYRPAIETVGGVPVIYELSAPDFRVDWEAFGQLITPRTRMVIINTPHNPCATCFSEADFLQLEKLLKNTNILLLSDEVYEHIVFDENGHTSVLSYPSLYQRSMATYSFGKTFHATGWKIGYVVGPEYLMKEFRKVHQFNVFSVNTPAQAGMGEYLKDASSYLSLPAFFREKRDYFTAYLEASPFSIIPSEGTYFQLVDYSSFSDQSDLEFVQWLTREIGVAAIPVSAFYSSGKDEKVIRFCFAKEKSTLKRAGERLAQLSE